MSLSSGSSELSPTLSSAETRPSYALSTGRIPRIRFLRAYWTTFRVLSSYLLLSFAGHFLGPEYLKERWSRLHHRNALRVERTLVQLQGLFIKVGQLISIMTNFLPEEFRRPLESLQDRVPPSPVTAIRQRIVQELGAPPEEIFAYFDPEPLASASLGQVHRATLKDGSLVVIKVQHPNMDRIVRLDLKTIRRILGLIAFAFRLRGLDVVYKQIRAMILAELDFQKEVEFMAKIAGNIEGIEGVRVPRPFLELCSERIITMSYCAGIKISRRQEILALGVDPSELARRLLRVYCKMIFVDGLYHADPHPGNLIVTQEGDLVLLDFGAVAQLSPAMKRGIPEFLEAVIRRDTKGIHRAMRTMGFIAHGNDAERSSERVIEYFHRRFQEEVHLESLNLKDIRIDPQRGLENLIDLRKHEISFRELNSAFQVPRDWVHLERTLLLISGVCTELDPQLNPFAVVRPYLEEFVFGKNRDFRALFTNAFKETAMMSLALPAELQSYLQKATRGELEVRVRGVSEGVLLMHETSTQWAHLLGAALLALSALFAESFLPIVEVVWALALGSAYCVLTYFFSRLRSRRLRRKLGGL